MLGPFAAFMALIGVVALIIVGIRALAGRDEAVAAPSETPPPPPPPQPPELPRTARRGGLLRFSVRHPLAIALIVVILVIVATMAYLPFAERATTIRGIEHPPSEYDKFFTYSQMEALTHFAMCDAMLFSTRPEDELENVKERLAIEAEFHSSGGPGTPGREGQYIRRVRSPEEIAEVIRLASEFYERVNCL